jgi:hypothetical protein
MPASLAQTELMMRIGKALLDVQMTEKIFRICLTKFLLGGEITLEKMEQEAKSGEKDTLGTFVKKLGKRIEVDPDFADVLGRFLKHRNDFVHNFIGMPGFGLATEQELNFGISFVSKLSGEAEHVRRVLKGLINVIGKGVGITEEKKHAPGESPDMDTIYEWIALMAFKPKQ